MLHASVSAQAAPGDGKGWAGFRGFHGRFLEVVFVIVARSWGAGASSDSSRKVDDRRWVVRVGREIQSSGTRSLADEEKD